MMNQDFKNRFNEWVKQKRAFLFLIDFEQENPLIFIPDEAFAQHIYFDFKGKKNLIYPNAFKALEPLNFMPVSKDFFSTSFQLVQQHLQKGDTYLLNLTFQTPVSLKNSLKDVFIGAKAPYKLYFKDEFVCFSPETFIQIKGDKITTYPMKGTIDASIPEAEKILLNNQKEYYEHNTIVDLLRNDLAMVARNISVERFRYVDTIHTPTHTLLQVSSEIAGELPHNWRDNAVEIFEKLLPAGSVSGAPKQKTMEIIQQAESSKRGYYTGIAGYFDGKNFDTAVLIRFLEKNENGMFYRSGGGVTALSNLDDEYNELNQKIYVPTD